MQRSLASDMLKPQGSFHPGGVNLLSKAKAVGSFPLKTFREVGSGGGNWRAEGCGQGFWAGDVPVLKSHAANYFHWGLLQVPFLAVLGNILIHLVMGSPKWD